MENMFACTATDILAARASSKGTLIQWSAQSTHQALGLATDATTFCAETRKRSASATHCQRFFEAVHFRAGVLGLPLGTECIAVRMTGSAERMTNTKRITVKAPPLSRKAPLSVGALHHDASTRVLAGFLHFKVSARLGCADAGRVTEELALDPAENGDGFLVVTATEGECARSAKMRDWDSRWWRSEKVRTSHGPEARCQTASWKTCDPGLHADASHEPRTRSGTCGACVSATVDRKSALSCRQGLRRQFFSSFTSHGCKATVLSWMAKAAAPTEDRRLLGGHAQHGERPLFMYSRDTPAGPLLKLKKWCPLNTRASAKQNASRTASRATPPTGCPALDSDHVRRGRIRDGSEQLRGGRRAACERCRHAGCHDTERFSRRHGAGRTVCH